MSLRNSAHNPGPEALEKAAARGHFVVENGSWLRTEDGAHLTVRVAARDVDLSSPEVREQLLDEAIAAETPAARAPRTVIAHPALAQHEAELERFRSWALGRGFSVEAAGVLRRAQGATFWDDATEAAWQRWKLAARAYVPKTRGELIALARQCALQATQRHGYLPASADEAAAWEPHDWVLDALQRATDGTQGEPT